MPTPRTKKVSSIRSQEARVLERAREDPNARTGMDVETLRRAYADHLQYTQGKDEHTATPLDRYQAIAASVRDRLVNRWIQTQQAYYKADAKRVYYLSLEFLMGRALGNNLMNLDLYEPMREALAGLGIELSDLLEQEVDAGLGNGGLGRLAACFLDSMATMSLPAYGYGIRYEFGIFEQDIRNGYQVELPEEWLRYGNPWELERPEYEVPVRFFGRTEKRQVNGRLKSFWVDTRNVLGMPYDTPIAGYRNDTVNTLRLWRARASQELDLADFNAGDYLAAVEDKNSSESISKVLYPNDLTVMGKELRLKQQYFFVACSIADIVRRYLKTHEGFAQFPEKVAIQLNDTHPAIAIAELMRVLVDEHDLELDEAWEICRATFGYTNHTLLPEALERWTVDLFGRVLPRHLEIIYDINHRFLEEVRRRYPGDNGKLSRMSLIEEGPVKQVRMAHLAVVGSHAVNGVAGLHTELLKADLFRDFHDFWPDKFNNKTNGVTPRRWLKMSNPLLADAITERIGARWTTDLDELRKLEPLADDAAFRQRFREIKRENKRLLAEIIKRENGITVDVDSVFDVQVKRIHEYKRQLLNVLHIVDLYNRIKADPSIDVLPRTFIFGGKAAPGYAMAKAIIKLINAVGDVVNHDVDVRGRLMVVFLKNYRVSYAERVFPAADLSEQISTAGKEASGTGNMKFALNGALTIGTLDGANVEIREEVGADNFFLFGLTVDEVKALKRQGYNPWESYRGNRALKAVLDAIGSGTFSPDEPRLFQPIVDSLLNGGDQYMLLADFASYVACQEEVSRVYLDYERWTKMAILNTARIGKFSSDRTIREYADEIWRVKPVQAD
ncbi:MAG: glycogen/starch/alpha-glucan phosphorylase [Myxococcales bacterium]|jgi:starch phosphorylase